jgi:hypothetical protein
MWVDSDLASPIAIEMFVFENEAAKVINRRVNYLPVEFYLDAEEGKEANKETWEEYFQGDYFDNKPLLQLLTDIYYDMELGGIAILVGYPNPDDPKSPIWIKQTNIEYYPETDDENIFKVKAYRFVLSRSQVDDKGNTEDVEVIIQVTPEEQTVTVNGAVQEENTVKLDISNGEEIILPVVLFCREDLDGVYCRPGMAELLNGQRNLNQGLTKRNQATKYDSFGVWCPDGEEYNGMDLSGNPSGNNKQWNIRPGSYVPFPIRKVGGATAISSIEKEVEEARDDIRAAGLFVDSTEVSGATNGESGRAKMIGTRGLRDYGARLLPKVKNSLNEMLEISGYISGTKTEGISFKAPPIEKEDPEMIANKADRMQERGFTIEALRIEGYSDDEAEKLIEEKKADIEEDDKRALALTTSESLELG